MIWLTCKLESDHFQIDPTNSTAISLNGLTIGADHFLVICNSLAANYSWSGYPIGTCDKTASTGGPADSNGDDQIAIASCTTGCASFTILDIYGVPGQQGTNTNGHFFQYGRAERVAGRVTPKAVWNASDWISVFGNSTAGFGLNAIDMTPRKWSAVAVSPTSKPSRGPTVSIKPGTTPSQRPTVRVTTVPIKATTTKPSARLTVKPTAKQSIVTLYKPTANPTAPIALLTAKPSARPTAKSTVLPFNLIITEITDPKDKYISSNNARYVEIYSADGAGQTINDPSLYLLRWTNGNAGKSVEL